MEWPKRARTAGRIVRDIAIGGLYGNHETL